MTLRRGDREVLFRLTADRFIAPHTFPAISAGASSAGAAFNNVDYRRGYGGDKKQSYQNIKYVHRSASLHKQAAHKVHQERCNPGNGTLPEYYVDRPFTAEFATDCRDGCNAGCIKKTEHQKREG